MTLSCTKNATLLNAFLTSSSTIDVASRGLTSSPVTISAFCNSPLLSSGCGELSTQPSTTPLQVGVTGTQALQLAFLLLRLDRLGALDYFSQQLLTDEKHAAPNYLKGSKSTKKERTSTSWGSCFERLDPGSSGVIVIPRRHKTHARNSETEGNIKKTYN